METQADAATGVEAPVGAFQQLLSYLQDGGPVLYLLLLISLLALTLILAKLLQFGLLRIGSYGFVSPTLKTWRSGQARQALSLLEGRRSPVAAVLTAALHGANRTDASEERVREEVRRVAQLEIDNLRSGLRALALIATLSPLIGLLGTVLGMIDAFQALEAAGNRVDPSILSGGIWVALLTTAAGLIVAIPAAVAHSWLEGIVEGCRRAMEDAVTQVFTSNGLGTPSEPAALRPGTAVVQPAE